MKVLAIGAHPDDIELGCIGTVLKHIAAGHSVYFAIVTKGDGQDGFENRLPESIRVHRVLGCAELYLLAFSEWDICCVKHELIDAIERVVKLVNPDRVYIHSVNDSHQVHEVVAKCSRIATRDIKEVWKFELPTTIGFRPNAFVDIGGEIDQKIELLKLYQSQVGKHYTEESIVRSVAKMRAYSVRLNGFVEAFEIEKQIIEEI